MKTTIYWASAIVCGLVASLKIASYVTFITFWHDSLAVALDIALLISVVAGIASKGSVPSRIGLLIVTTLLSFIFDNAALRVGAALATVATFILLGRSVSGKVKTLLLAFSSISYIFLIVGYNFLVFGFVNHTIIEERISPNGNIRGRLIESDQGALGGDTAIVQSERRAYFFSKESVIWSGRWGDRPMLDAGNDKVRWVLPIKNLGDNRN